MMLFSAVPAKGGNKQEGGLEAGGSGALIIWGQVRMEA